MIILLVVHLLIVAAASYYLLLKIGSLPTRSDFLVEKSCSEEWAELADDVKSLALDPPSTISDPSWTYYHVTPSRLIRREGSFEEVELGSVGACQYSFWTHMYPISRGEILNAIRVLDGLRAEKSALRKGVTLEAEAI